MSSMLVKQVKRLLLSGIILGVGFWAMPGQAQVSEGQVRALVQALRDAAQQRAPGNNGLVSEWQILPENIPRWSRQCTGQALTSAQFEASTGKAREILVCVMRDVLRDEYKASGNSESLAVRRAAAWWMTGNPNRYNSDSTAAYTQNVLSFYQKQRTDSQAAQPAPTPLPKPPAVGQVPRPTPQPSPKPSTRASSSTLVSNAQVGRLVEALRLAAQQRAPGNNGLVSEWQILPENIPRWSKQCHTQELTPSQFEASPVTARAILVCVMRDILNEQYKASGNNESLAVRRTAAWWMTGDANQYKSDSTAAYTQNVLGFYQPSSSSQAQSPATPAQPAPSGQAAQPTASTAAAAQISNTQVGRLVEALRQAAPETDQPDDELYGAWQVKAENIPRWSQQCIGKELTPIQFQDSPVTARSILVCVMRDVLSEQYKASNNDESLAVQRAAAWWMTGDPSQYNSGAIATYSQRVLNLYREPNREPSFRFFSHI
ncbi:hypothetical protein Mic7113_4102 [Allocoleopsis franciscana PCC 7113]|uniref:Uncharacterized protein n=2 Tax=Allocoleopsis TaxID=2886347 RepID=K9WJ52_9CYAN|nr:hypothetical protein Mic7113_4102 [Allocoleopsis franciscana PCC 7113]